MTEPIHQDNYTVIAGEVCDFTNTVDKVLFLMLLWIKLWLYYNSGQSSITLGEKNSFVTLVWQKLIL